MKSILDTNLIKHRNVNYQELVKYIFVENNGKKIILQNNDLRTNKDIFTFCFDLFCKGLLICHGYADNVVHIDNLTLDDIRIVIDKLSYSGIITIIQVETDLLENGDEDNYQDRQKSAHYVISESIRLLNAANDNDQLDNFSFRLKVMNLIYVIRFKIVRL
jgi:hypothetical protein